MKNILSLIIAVSLSITLILPNRAQAAEIPAKAKAFLTIAGYGTAGGALLGAASMAFGTSTRAIAQGASLGLYAGLIFGTYVLVSHHQKTRYARYDDEYSPYRRSRELYNDSEYDSSYGGGDSSSSGRGGFFDRHQEIQTKFNYKQKGGSVPPIYVNFLNYNF
ncbi:MAG TPA: hypothetical protein VKZ84_06920 [Bacteriovoracaceae bacterium]|nr:hypothetical protein [Bacteriovoracaceae bacterium]